MEKEIRLYNRYHEDNRLVRIGDESSKRYKLKTESEFLRCGINEDNPERLTFVDPSGGPFISEGTKIGKNVVKAIYKGVIIEFE